MRRVELASITPGCTLAKPVLDSMGRVLLRAGAQMTPTVVTCLERWSIAAVFVADDAPPPNEEASNSSGLLCQYWNQVFAPHNDNSEMLLIHAALRRWQEARIASKEPKA